MSLVGLVPSRERAFMGILWIQEFFSWAGRGSKFFFSSVFYGSKIFSRRHFVGNWGIWLLLQGCLIQINLQDVSQFWFLNPLEYLLIFFWSFALAGNICIIIHLSYYLLVLGRYQELTCFCIFKSSVKSFLSKLTIDLQCKTNCLLSIWVESLL